MPYLTGPDGNRLFYLDEGRGPPVLLLHAFPLSGESFRPQLEALADRYRFLVPDHRGFGRSTLPPGDTVTLMSQLARDALALLESFEIPQIVVAGVSMGGYAAMAMLREDPSRVAGLVLVDTRPAADDAAVKARREETARELLEAGLEPLVASMAPKLLRPEAPDALHLEVESQIRAGSPAGAAAASRGMALRPDSREILARFGGPALVICGERDTLAPPNVAREMAELISGARLEVIPEAAHLPNQEAPEVFNRHLEAFLSSMRLG